MYKNLYLEENIFTPAEYHSTLLIQDFDPTVKKKKKVLCTCLLSRKPNKSLKEMRSFVGGWRVGGKCHVYRNNSDVWF